VQLDREVEGRLTAEGGKECVGTLAANDFGDRLDR
jgi:hypothetical protein